MKRMLSLVTLVGVMVGGGLIRSASAKVCFVVRAQDAPSTATIISNVWCYASGTNDRAGYVSVYTQSNLVWTTNSRGAGATGDHAWNGGQALDGILPDGLVFSLNIVGDDIKYRKYHVWDMSDGSQVYTNTTQFGHPYTYLGYAPMRKVTGLSNGDIPDGSLAGINRYRWGGGDAVAVFHRSGAGFSDTPRFRTVLTPVPAEETTCSISYGLTSGVDFWGHVYANNHIVASLKNGVILCGYSGGTNVWVVNPDNGANTNAVCSSDVVPLQGTLAMPDGDIGLVGGNRKIRFYRPTYVGTDAPTLGPVVRSVDLPGTAWICDASAFRDGTIGISINYDQTTAANPENNDVVERWSIEGDVPVLLETMTAYGARIGGIHGDSAIRLPGTLIVFR